MSSTREWAVLALMFTALAGCSTSVRMQVKRAPELNLVGVKTIRVDDFGVSGSLDLDLVSGGGLIGAVVGVAAQVGMNAVSDKHADEIQEEFISGLKKEIFANGYYTVTTAEDPQCALSGEVYYSVSDDVDENEHEDKKGKKTKEYVLTRTAEVTVTFAAIDAEGNIVGSSKVTSQVSRQTSQSSRSSARSSIEGWESMVRRALRKSQAAVVKKIAPYYVWETRTLKDGDSDEVEAGNKAAKKGDWKAAAEHWQGAQASGNRADKIASLYNLGVYDEVEAKLPDALKKFQQCQEMTGGSEFSGDIRRVERRIDEVGRLEAALKAQQKAVAAPPKPAPAATPPDGAAQPETPAAPAKATESTP